VSIGSRVDIQFQLAGPDLERLVVVGSDLEFLLSLPRDRLLTHTEVRLSAAVLRRPARPAFKTYRNFSPIAIWLVSGTA
jgi:hypothetical protein